MTWLWVSLISHHITISGRSRRFIWSGFRVTSLQDSPGYSASPLGHQAHTTLELQSIFCCTVRLKAISRSPISQGRLMLPLRRLLENGDCAVEMHFQCGQFIRKPRWPDHATGIASTNVGFRDGPVDNLKPRQRQVFIHATNHSNHVNSESKVLQYVSK